MSIKPLDPLSEVVDTQRRWNPEWYTFLTELTNPNIMKAAELPNLVTSTIKPTVADKAFVSDATSSAFGTIVAGGGTIKVPVYFDGTNWRVG